MTEIPHSADDIILFSDSYARSRLNEEQRMILDECYDSIEEASRDRELSDEDIGRILIGIPGARETITAYQNAVQIYKAKMN